MTVKSSQEIPALWLQTVTAGPAPATFAAKAELRVPPLAAATMVDRAVGLGTWLGYASPALFHKRLDGKSFDATYKDGSAVVFSSRRFAHEPALWTRLFTAPTTVQLTTLLGKDTTTIVDAMAGILVHMHDTAFNEVLPILSERLFRELGVPLPSGVAVDVKAASVFIRDNLSAIMDAMRTRLSARRRDDVARMTQRLADNPHLSLHELWLDGIDQRPHASSSYFESLRSTELAPLLNRRIDNMGNEPNYLLAAHFANYLLGQDKGTAYATAVKGFRDLLEKRGWLKALREYGWHDFTTAEADQLRIAYPFIPHWSSGRKHANDANFADLPSAMRARFAAISRIPLASDLLLAQAAIRDERDWLRDTVLVTTEHALADKMDLFRHLIAHDGMRGEDIRVVWKEKSADPLVIELAERCFNVHGRVAHGTAVMTADQALELFAREALETAVDEARGRTINVHLQGVRAWDFAGELALRYPDVDINACSHTTSDAAQVSEQPAGLDRIALTAMAEAPAKIRFERYVFTPTFTRVMLDVDNRFETETGGLRNRQAIVFGGAGRIIGGAVVDGLLSQRFATAVVDPFLSTPKGAPKRQRLLAAGVEIFDTQAQLDARLASRPTFLINATAHDVFASYGALGQSAVTMNLGTGDKGFSMALLRSKATARRELLNDTDRHQVSAVYDVLGKDDTPIEICALGDGGVFNLGERGPNPRLLSAFNNTLIVESLHQSKFNRDRGRLGPQVLDSVRVSFTREDRPRPVISFMARDVAPAPWPREWTGDPGLQPNAAIVITTETGTEASSATGAVGSR